MQDVKLNDKELTKLILYGVSENGLDESQINSSNIKYIINFYRALCNDFRETYVSGELDTFKEAACLLVAINKMSLVSDKKINASIAIDAAYKMCETPYWNIGENYDIPYKMEEVNFKTDFSTLKNNIEVYEMATNMLLESLVHEDGVPMNYYLNLELFYRAALLTKNYKKNNKPIINDVVDDETPTLAKNKKKSLIRRIFFRQ